jgi:hypothetical protein
MTVNPNTILCDKHDIPLLIQKIRYVYSRNEFEVMFFTGEIMPFRAGDVCSEIFLFHEPTIEQMAEAESFITQAAKSDWRTWFPNLKIVK